MMAALGIRTASEGYIGFSKVKVSFHFRISARGAARARGQGGTEVRDPLCFSYEAGFSLFSLLRTP